MSGLLPVEALSALSPQALALVAGADNAASASASASTAAPMAAGGSFGGLVADGLTKVNSQLLGSQTSLQKLALGDTRNLHQVMIDLEESRLSFQYLMQVRSRLLEAYQDIMKMPI